MFGRIIGISMTLMATVVLPTFAQAQDVSRLVAERQQIQNQVQACAAASVRYAPQQAREAQQGRLLPMLPCTNNYSTWAVRVWQYDIAIARAQGDRRPACQIKSMPGCENYRR